METIAILKWGVFIRPIAITEKLPVNAPRDGVCCKCKGYTKTGRLLDAIAFIGKQVGR